MMLIYRNTHDENGNFNESLRYLEDGLHMEVKSLGVHGLKICHEPTSFAEFKEENIKYYNQFKNDPFGGARLYTDEELFNDIAIMLKHRSIYLDIDGIRIGEKFEGNKKSDTLL
jgi:hypothetical protein